jgi:hypothetical protein
MVAEAHARWCGTQRAWQHAATRILPPVAAVALIE